VLVHDGDGRVHGDIGVLDEAVLHVLLLGKLSSLRSDLDDIRLAGVRLNALGVANRVTSSLRVSLSFDVSASALGFGASSLRTVLTPATRLGILGAKQFAFVS